MTDGELIQAVAMQRDSEAYRELVRRYLGLVYSAACRQAGGARTMAEDVAQSVFLLVWEKPSRVRAEAMGGWLINTTRLAVRGAQRQERRLKKREQVVASMQPETALSDFEQRQLREMLDRTLAGLNELDRTAVALRYLQEKPLEEVAAAMRISPAAGKRVSRALEKIRAECQRQGLGMSSVALGAAMGKLGFVVPAGLSAKVAGFATGVKATAGAVAIMKGLWMGWVTKTAAIAGTTVAVAGAVVGTGLYVAPWRYGGEVAAKAGPANVDMAGEWRPVVATAPAGMPYEKGWPIALPGSVCSTPVVADIRGDGNPVIIVTTVAWSENGPVLFHLWTGMGRRRV